MSASGGANTTVNPSKDAEQDKKSDDSDKKSESSDETSDEDAAAPSEDPVNEEPASEEYAYEEPAHAEPAYEEPAHADTTVSDAVVEIPEIPAESAGSDQTPNATVTERAGADDPDNDSHAAAQRSYESPLQSAPEATKPDIPDAEAGEEPALLETESATAPVTTIRTEPVLTPVSVTEPVEVAAAAPAGEVPDLMAGVLAWVGLGPVTADAPALPPVEAPALWGLLEFARRQEQQTLSNRAPTIAYDPTANVELADGTIVGDLRAVDPDGDALTFTVTQKPEHGTVVVHRDGTFTYTPDAEFARYESDTFTIDISDGLATRVSDPADSLKVTLHRPPQLYDPLAGADDIDPSPDVKVFPKVVDTVDVGDPNEMAVSPDGTRLYVTNAGLFSGNTVTVIDTASNSVVATITVGNNPREVVVSPDGGTAYVANAGDGTVSVIDTTTNTVTTTISVGVVPDGLAVSPDGDTLYVTQNDGTVSVIDTTDNNSVTTIAVGQNSHNLAVSPDGGTVYVTNTDDDTVSVIDLGTNSVTTIAVGDDPLGIAVTPDGARVYVTNANDDTVSVIDTATNSVTTIAVGDFPEEVTVSADGAYAYVVNGSDGTVSVIDTATNVVIGTIAVGSSPSGVAVSPDGDTLYVANHGDDTVSVIDLSAL